MSNMNMAGYEDAVRTRAYYIWENEGCPFGRDVEHWHASEAEMRSEQAAHAEAQAEPVKAEAEIAKPKAKAAKPKAAAAKAAAKAAPRKKAAPSPRVGPMIEYRLQ